MSNKILISLFDHSGNQSRPYRENGWEVVQIDIKHGLDVMDFDPAKFIAHYLHRPMIYHMPDVFVIAPIPCTCYALSGNRHKAKRLLTGEFAEAQKLVEKTRQIIGWLKTLLATFTNITLGWAMCGRNSTHVISQAMLLTQKRTDITNKRGYGETSIN